MNKIVGILMASIICTVLVFPQNPVCNTENVYVLFNFENYDENKNAFRETMLTKFIKNNKIEFSKGSDNMNLINEFIFDCTTGTKRKIPKKELSQITISTIEDLDKEATKRGFKENPGKAFGRISLIEKNKQGEIYLYNNVEWRKIVSME